MKFKIYYTYAFIPVGFGFESAFFVNEMSRKKAVKIFNEKQTKYDLPPFYHIKRTSVIFRFYDKNGNCSHSKVIKLGGCVR